MPFCLSKGLGGALLIWLTLKQLGFFFKIQFYFVMFTMNVIFLYETAPVNEYLVSSVDTDCLVFQYQGISSHSAEYAPTRMFPLLHWLTLDPQSQYEVPNFGAIVLSVFHWRNLWCDWFFPYSHYYQIGIGFCNGLACNWHEAITCMEQFWSGLRRHEYIYRRVETSRRLMVNFVCLQWQLHQATWSR